MLVGRVLLHLRLLGLGPKSLLLLLRGRLVEAHASLGWGNYHCRVDLALERVSWEAGRRGLVGILLLLGEMVNSLLIRPPDCLRLAIQ